GRAWQMCRMGQADPEAFGIMDMHGLWFVRGNVVRDVASLNKMEMLPWDVWGVIAGRDEDLAAEDWVALDEAAALTAQDDPPFSAVRRFYAEHARWQVPEA
ncbi:MAG: transglutaminase domain-containing protein, partial [Chloroflexi bacterium]|nr:transglutaminase domain-containing protein [Chloroflexota bacterium]